MVSEQLFTIRSLKVYLGEIGRLCLYYRQVVFAISEVYEALLCHFTIMYCNFPDSVTSHWIRISQVVPRHVILKNLQINLWRQIEKPCTDSKMYFFLSFQFVFWGNTWFMEKLLKSNRMFPYTFIQLLLNLTDSWVQTHESFVKTKKLTLISSVQSLSHVWIFATPWTAALQASLSITNSWSLPKLMSIKPVR